MREGLPCLFCYLRYLTDKVINDSDFLYFLSINLFDFSHQNFADEPVQHHFIQFFNGCIVPDLFDESADFIFLFIRVAHHQQQVLQALLVGFLLLFQCCCQLHKTLLSQDSFCFIGI